MTNEELFYAYVEEVTKQDESIRAILTVRVNDIWMCNITSGLLVGDVVPTVELELSMKKGFLQLILSELTLSDTADKISDVIDNILYEHGIETDINYEYGKFAYCEIYNIILYELSRYNVHKKSQFEVMDIRGMGLPKEHYYITIGIKE